MQGLSLLWEASLLTQEHAFFTGLLHGLQIGGSDGCRSYKPCPLHSDCWNKACLSVKPRLTIGSLLKELSIDKSILSPLLPPPGTSDCFPCSLVPAYYPDGFTSV